MGDEDAALLAAAAAGSQAAFSRLVDRHQASLRAFLRRICHGVEEADDLAQETFLTAWNKAASFRGAASVRTWLFAIAWRQASRARRGWLRGRARDTAWAEHTELQAPIGAGREEAMAVRTALAALPLEQKAALALCLGGEFSHSEAAEALGLPQGTVKSHVSRGRGKILEMLGERA